MVQAAYDQTAIAKRVTPGAVRPRSTQASANEATEAHQTPGLGSEELQAANAAPAKRKGAARAPLV